MQCLFYFGIFIVLFLEVTSYDVQSDKVRDLLELNSDFEAKLRKFSQKYNELYIFMKTKLREYNEEEKRIDTNSDKYLSHPLNVFLLNKRMGMDFAAIMANIKHIGKVFLELMEDVSQRGPSEEQLVESYKDYLRAKKMEYNIQDLADGKIDNEEFRVALTSIDCYLIGHLEGSLKNYDEANEWLSLAAERYDPIEGAKYNLKKSEIYDKIKKNEDLKNNVISEDDASSITEQSFNEIYPQGEKYPDDISKIIEKYKDDIENYRKIHKDEL